MKNTGYDRTFRNLLLVGLVSWCALMPATLSAGNRQDSFGNGIVQDVVANGGGAMQSGSSSLVGTVGQTAAGNAVSPSGGMLRHGVHALYELGGTEGEAEGEAEGEGEGEEPPQAQFSANPTLGRAPLTVQFTDQSIPGNHPITQWYWSFGDGDTSSARNPAHTYTDNGSFPVSLTVSSDAGSDTCQQEACVVTSTELPAASLVAMASLMGLAVLAAVLKITRSRT